MKKSLIKKYGDDIEKNIFPDGFINTQMISIYFIYYSQYTFYLNSLLKLEYPICETCFPNTFDMNYARMITHETEKREMAEMISLIQKYKETPCNYESISALKTWKN